MKWSPSEIEWLLIGRDAHNMSFSECADHMQREFKKTHYTTRSCIGAYARALKKRIALSESVRNEVRGES